MFDSVKRCILKVLHFDTMQKHVNFCKEMRSPSICAVNWSTVAVEIEAKAAVITIEQVLDYETWTSTLSQSDRHVHIKFHVKTLLSLTNNDLFNKQNRDSYQPMTMRRKKKRKKKTKPTRTKALYIAKFCTTFCGCVLCSHWIQNWTLQSSTITICHL